MPFLPNLHNQYSFKYSRLTANPFITYKRTNAIPKCRIDGTAFIRDLISQLYKKCKILHVKIP